MMACVSIYECEVYASYTAFAKVFTAEAGRIAEFDISGTDTRLLSVDGRVSRCITT